MEELFLKVVFFYSSLKEQINFYCSVIILVEDILKFSLLSQFKKLSFPFMDEKNSKLDKNSSKCALFHYYHFHLMRMFVFYLNSSLNLNL